MIEVKAKKRTGTIIYHILVCGFGLLMLYPLFWMFMSSFKDTNTIFTTARSLIPDPFTLENYANGWKGFAGVSFATFFKNSLFVAVLGTIGTLASSACVAFGFARCQFRGKKLLFGAMLASMMLPGQILMVPQYLWYEKLGWVGSFAAKIDGCSYYGIFGRIILPLMSPALITGAIFSFMWRWDDFMSALLYIDDPYKYPVSLALKLFCDPGSSSDYGAMFAISSRNIWQTESLHQA